MLENTLFYLVVLAQIILLSHLFPQKLVKRMRYICEHYPPSEYPKLYSKPMDQYVNFQNNLLITNKVIMILGLVFIFCMLCGQLFYTGSLPPKEIIALYGMMQYVPMVMIELSEWNEMKHMRNTYEKSKRKAELKPRRFFDYVPARLVGFGILAFSAYVFLDLAWHDFKLDFSSDSIQRIIVLLFGNLIFAAIILFNLYGRKLNPLQKSEDRDRQISYVIKSLILISIAMSIFYIGLAAEDVFEMEAFEATLMSVYFIVLGLITFGMTFKEIKIDQVDFNVYKDDSAVKL